MVANGSSVCSGACADLWWASRGGGDGNLGAVTSYALQLMRAVPEVLIGQVCFAQDNTASLGETWLWFFFVGMAYMSCGIEALHLGQIQLMAQSNTDGMALTSELLTALRSYAVNGGARRSFVLCNAHAYEAPWVYDGTATAETAATTDQLLLFDFHAFPCQT